MLRGFPRSHAHIGTVTVIDMGKRRRPIGPFLKCLALKLTKQRAKGGSYYSTVENQCVFYCVFECVWPSEVFQK